MTKIIFSKEQTDQIIYSYLNENQSLQKIGEQFGVCRSVISRILNENNVSLRTRTPQYKANYNIFEKIDTPEKAYWLGFIAADGCNYQRENNASIVISIHRKDREHLKKFQSFMETNAEIKDFVQNEGFSNNTLMSKIVLNSKKMSQNLADLGITPKKSLILKEPNIPTEFYFPFILGYFDGDGSISFNQKNNNLSISFVGTQELLLWISDILKMTPTLSKRNKGSDKNNFQIRCGGTNKPMNIMKSLYESSPVCLERKYLIFLKFLASRSYE